MNRVFKALVVEELAPNEFRAEVKVRKIDDLPPGDLLIKVHYSALNYKDALSANGSKGITRKYPHTPGIDASGVVEDSNSAKFKAGDKVIVTGYDLGMNTSGGFAEYIRVPADWAVPLPGNLSLREAMIYGTAGFTAGLAINELQKNGIVPGSGKVIVTGATGGVGSLAVAMLVKQGYDVAASTGKAQGREFLGRLGVGEILGREELNDMSGKPLLQKRWAGAVDNVGGNTLSTIIRSMDHRGVVASIGMVESPNLSITVFPFILRGVTIAGIDSAERPMNERLNIWEKIAGPWKIDNLEGLVRETGLEGLIGEIGLILRGMQMGKVLVKL